MLGITMVAAPGVPGGAIMAALGILQSMLSFDESALSLIHISGGEEGALNGASIMPGGSEKAWSEVKPILQSIAAKAPDGTPCCQ